MPEQCGEAVLEERIRGGNSSGIPIKINTLILIVTSFSQRLSIHSVTLFQPRANLSLCPFVICLAQLLCLALRWHIPRPQSTIHIPPGFYQAEIYALVTPLPRVQSGAIIRSTPIIPLVRVEHLIEAQIADILRQRSPILASPENTG